jgi:hypothetical protein
MRILSRDIQRRGVTRSLYAPSVQYRVRTWRVAATIKLHSHIRIVHAKHESPMIRQGEETSSSPMYAGSISVISGRRRLQAVHLGVGQRQRRASGALQTAHFR